MRARGSTGGGDEFPPRDVGERRVEGRADVQHGDDPLQGRRGVDESGEREDSWVAETAAPLGLFVMSFYDGYDPCVCVIFVRNGKRRVCIIRA